MQGSKRKAVKQQALPVNRKIHQSIESLLGLLDSVQLTAGCSLYRLSACRRANAGWLSGSQLPLLFPFSVPSSRA